MQNIESKPIFKLTLSAVLVALGTVLSFIKIISLPLCGSVTLLSMFPIVSISLMFGIQWGLTSSFAYALIQLALGITLDGLFGWGLTPIALLGTIFLDYIFAYTVLGLAGLFRKKGYGAMCFCTAAVVFLRGVFHFISGVVIFAQVEKFVVFGESFVNRPVLYSLCYNGFYMFPELISTTVAAIIFFRLPQIKRLIDIK